MTIEPSLAAAAPTGSLSAFDHVRRGDAAPSWVHGGVCRSWDLDPGRTAVALIAVSENITFMVRVDGVPAMVVRLGRPGYAESIEHVRSELLWVEALQQDAGVPTPSPRHGSDGDLVQFVVDDSGASWTAVAFDFVTGTMLEDQSDFASHFTEIGALTARLHGHSRQWARPTGFQRFAWGLDDMTGGGARWGDWRNAALTPQERHVVERAEHTARALLSGVPRTGEHWGLIHSDLRPSNVMTHDGAMTIIDFDDCGDGYYLYDFGAALTFYEHRPEALEMGARWLDGYRSVASLSRDDLEVAGALSLMRRLTMLGWATTHRADALPADLWDENLPGTVEVAARYLDDPLWLVGA
ncbi:phosphotransferase enzyme family protein [Frondihabitans australicus]|uniref:Ser/Thr protein kinase RdoA (MazF antagonist) n=1 Tax=Frondihabitans australicus TaxID=386892 RepID=A0A495ILH7_9MICO|nr:phosphotransferase [Frondihabitans australicus]RKR76619.1 Ser/Thr protein kinase RdoA (MazF antagonist) [Frondihabitans australicus]